MFNFSTKNKNVANKGGRTRKSSGSDQDCFSSQDQTMSPSCTDIDTDTESDTATDVLAAVI